MKIKKWLLPVLILGLALVVLTGCGKDKEDKDKDKNQGESTEAAAPVFESQTFDIGEFSVTYTGHELMKDIAGRNCIAVHYTFANNSANSTNFFWNIYDTMMQNGKELTGAFIYLNDNLDLLTDSTTKDVESGKSIDVTCTYVLGDTEAPVQITLSDLTDTTTKTFEIQIAGLPVAEAFMPEGLDPAASPASDGTEPADTGEAASDTDESSGDEDTGSDGEESYDEESYDEESYDEESYDEESYDEESYDEESYDEENY